MLLLIIMLFLQGLDSRLQKAFDLPNEYKQNRVQAALQDSKGQFWFAARGAGLLLKNDQWQLLTEDSGLISNGITSLLESSDNSIWVAGIEGISHFKNSKWQKISLKADIGIDINSRALIFSIQEDKKGNIWIGANGGAAVLRGSTWTSYKATDGLKHHVVHDVIRDRFDQIWFATRKAGLNLSKVLKWFYYYPNRNARKLLLTENDHLWIAAAPGVIEYTQQKWIEHKPELEHALFPIFEYQNNGIWFYDEQNKNIYIYENLIWRELKIGLEVDLLFKGNNERIYILSKGTLYQYNS